MTLVLTLALLAHGNFTTSQQPTRERQGAVEGVVVDSDKTSIGKLRSSDHAADIPDQKRIHATFAASNGDVIELDTRTGTLDTPRSRSTGLQDCSDKFQVCLTDHHGFAFAYFRKCTDAGFG